MPNEDPIEPRGGQRSGVRALWPLLTVRDLQRSMAFYTQTLGFEVAGKAEGAEGVFWCRIRRGGACLMLQQQETAASPLSGPAPSVEFYFVCDDVDEIFEELCGKELVLEPPSEAYYGMKQLFVPDPDGYAVVFESPTENWSS